LHIDTPIEGYKLSAEPFMVRAVPAYSTVGQGAMYMTLVLFEGNAKGCIAFLNRLDRPNVDVG
jgi:hypothetical protein